MKHILIKLLLLISLGSLGACGGAGSVGGPGGDFLGIGSEGGQATGDGGHEIIDGGEGLDDAGLPEAPASSPADFGGPIDIPIPIAKARQGHLIDSTKVKADFSPYQSFKMNEDDSLSIFKKAWAQEENYFDGAIELSGEIGSVASSAVLWFFNQEGEVIHTDKADADGAWTVQIDPQKAYLEDPIAVCHYKDKTCSEVVVAVVHEKSFPFNLSVFYNLANYPSNIQISNKTLKDEKLSLASNQILYQAVDTNSQAHLVTTNPKGVDFKKYIDGNNELINDLYFIPNQAAVLYVTPQGDVKRLKKLSGQIDLVSDSQISGPLSLSNNGEYFCAIHQDHIILEALLGDKLQGDRIQIKTTTSDPYKECQWVGSDKILAVSTTEFLEETLYQVELFDLSGEDLSQSSLLLSPQLLLSTFNEDLPCIKIHNVALNPINQVEFKFECLQEDGSQSLYKAKADEYQSAELLVGSPYTQIKESVYTLDGEIFFEALLTQSRLEQSLIGFYDAAYNMGRVLTYGSKPRAHPVDSNLIVYFSPDSIGGQQISILNRSLCEPLSEDEQANQLVQSEKASSIKDFRTYF